MKKTYLSVAVVCLLGASLLGSSCIGSFQLTNKLLSWNRPGAGRIGSYRRYQRAIANDAPPTIC